MTSTQSNVSGQNKDPNSSSRKRKLNSPTTSFSKKKKVEVDYQDPRNRVVTVPNRQLKEKFALNTCPVRDGLRNEKGEVVTKPRGGPYGLAEWVLESLQSKKGNALMQKIFQSSDNCYGALRALVSFIGTVDYDAMIYLLRSIPVEEINRIFNASIENGFKVLEEIFKIDPKEMDPLKCSKIKRSQHFQRAYFTSKARYLDLVKEQAEKREQALKRSPISQNKDDEIMLDLSDDELPKEAIEGNRGEKN
jgi:hypothetical protein